MAPCLSSPGPPSPGPPPSALSRIPTELWALILHHALYVPPPPGYLLHPPSALSPTTPGAGAFTLLPFQPPHMHWDGLRSPVACAYTHKLRAVTTRRTLAHVSRAFSQLVHGLEGQRSTWDWLCLPMDMDSRRAIIALAEEHPFGRTGRLVRRIEFSPGAEHAGLQSDVWTRRPDEPLMRRIVAHCQELEELWCGVDLSGLGGLAAQVAGRTLRVFSHSGVVHTREVYALLAHCPHLEVLRFTALAAPVDPASQHMPTDDEPFLPYGPLPPLALRTLALCLTEAADPLLGWMASLQLPQLTYFKIERDYRRGAQPGADAAADAAGWQQQQPLQQQPPHPLHAWQPPPLPPGFPPAPQHPQQHQPPSTDPPLPPGLHAFLLSHGPSLRTLEVLEPSDPLLQLPSLGWACLALCEQAEQFVTTLSGAAWGMGGTSGAGAGGRACGSLRSVGCWGFYLDVRSSGSSPGPSPAPAPVPWPPASAGVPGDEEALRRVKAHCENVLDAVIALLGGEWEALERVRFWDVQRGRAGGGGGVGRVVDAVPVGVEGVPPGTGRGYSHAHAHPHPPSAPGLLAPHRHPPTPAPAASNSNSYPADDPPSPSDDSDGWTDPTRERDRPEYARTLRTIRELCAANGVRFEDAQGELVDCWAGRRAVWAGGRGLA
ncbi:hypothetical protein CALCODRAFT_509454 [Calocera cornea HHB12733]|uniref:Uncharacterized protein n=1 Tax=Calocera cornea HHB12733 TaxID=1353952 RepID=A0A165FAY1_9BASI|nr:hypothetical protein CALCODRAFT_509454 [Calocera cornea HHB12733]